jgi:hypothetical protein
MYTFFISARYFAPVLMLVLTGGILGRALPKITLFVSYSLYHSPKTVGRIGKFFRGRRNNKKGAPVALRLMNILFFDRFAKQMSQLGNVTVRFKLILEKEAIINYSRKVFKKRLQ